MNPLDDPFGDAETRRRRLLMQMAGQYPTSPVPPRESAFNEAVNQLPVNSDRFGTQAGIPPQPVPWPSMTAPAPRPFVAPATAPEMAPAPRGIAPPSLASIFGNSPAAAAGGVGAASAPMQPFGMSRLSPQDVASSAAADFRELQKSPYSGYDPLINVQVTPDNQLELLRATLARSAGQGQQNLATRAQDLAVQTATADRNAMNQRSADEIAMRDRQHEAQFGPKAASQRYVEGIRMLALSGQISEAQAQRAIAEAGNQTGVPTPGGEPLSQAAQIGQILRGALKVTPGGKPGELPTVAGKAGFDEFGAALKQIPDAALSGGGLSQFAQDAEAGMYGPVSGVEDALAKQIAGGQLKTLPFFQSGLQPSVTQHPLINMERDQSLLQKGLSFSYPNRLVGGQGVDSIRIKSPTGERVIPIDDAKGGVYQNLLTSDVTRAAMEENRRRAELMLGAIFDRRRK